MVIESKRYKETVGEIVDRRAEEAKEEKIMLEKINNSRRILTESLQKYADSSMTSDDLLQDLIKVLDKYGIRDSTRLREVLECLYILLTV
ncbi:hypothetical protein, partial [Enterocloster clostridioformis]|uniref:hypothetical protein n=1 Tax=Enterocloster clostridioformis TaxID=1531 RepID=UPI002ED5B544